MMNSSVLLLLLKNIVIKVNLGILNEVKILWGLNLDVYDGDFIIVFGLNGVGKLIFFNMISGELLVDSGIIQLCDQDII